MWNNSLRHRRVRLPDTSSLLNVSYWQTKTPSQKPYNKLQYQATWPFRIMGTQKHNTTVDRDGLPDIVYTDRVAHAPSRTNRGQPAKTRAQPALDSTKDSRPSDEHDYYNNKDEYVFEHIVSHIGEGDTLCYVVRLCRCGTIIDKKSWSHIYNNTLSTATEDTSIRTNINTTVLNMTTVRYSREKNKRNNKVTIFTCRTMSPTR